MYTKLEVPHDCQIESLEQIYNKWLLPNAGEDPVFVEVGAYDGISWSNTYALSKLGWKGLYVEPVSEYARACSLNHSHNPEIKVVCCAVGEVESKARIAVAASITTLDKDHLEAYKEISWAKEALEQNFSGVREVQVYRLETILDAVGLKNADLLVIDVEGYEESVLRSFDLKQLDPKMLICEIQDGHKDFARYSEIVEREQRVRNFILNSGYSEVYRDQVNTVFVKQEIFNRTKDST